MVNRSKALILTIIFIAVVILTSLLFEFGLITYFEDPLQNSLFCSIMPRAILSILFIYIIKAAYSERAFDFRNGGLKGLLWSIPCFLVAFANFPYSALINGTAEIIRMDLMYLYIIDVVVIGIYEELVFRAFLVNAVKSFFLRNNHKNLFTVLISAGIFALLHSLNFRLGFSLDTLLQIGYTFLIGCMLATLYLYGKNIYICIIIHALFDFGGLLISTLGKGTPWDTVFWILTAVCGVFCAVHVVFTIIKMDKRESYVS